ncbi:MAG: outer membrane beta-barrel protein, partial [Hyphomicrobiaceae bacterium]
KKYGAERVSDRDREDFQPEGLRTGNYFIFPSLGASVVFDDNLFRSDLNKVSDIRFETTPSVKLQSSLPRHVLDLSLAGKIVSHLENTDQDYANVRAKLDGALHFDHAHTLSASVLSALEHEELGEISTPLTAAQPIAVAHHKASVGLTRDVGRLYGTLMATAERWDFSDVRSRGGAMIEQDTRDTNQFSTALRLGYRISPGFDVVAKLRMLIDDNRGNDLIDRDATGYEAMAGLAFETSPLLRWRLLGGYGYRNFDSAALDDVSTAIVEGQVQWLPTQSMTFTGLASRQIISADATEDSGRIETVVSGRIDYEIWHNTVLNLGLEFKDAEFVGVDRNDRSLAGRFGVEYFMNKNWLFTAGYEYAVRESTEPSFDMHRNRFTIGAKLRF